MKLNAVNTIFTRIYKYFQKMLKILKMENMIVTNINEIFLYIKITPNKICGHIFNIHRKVWILNNV